MPIKIMDLLKQLRQFKQRPLWGALNKIHSGRMDVEIAIKFLEREKDERSKKLLALLRKAAKSIRTGRDEVISTLEL